MNNSKKILDFLKKIKPLKVPNNISIPVQILIEILVHFPKPVPIQITIQVGILI